MANFNVSSPADDSEWNMATAYFWRIHTALAEADSMGMNHNYRGQLDALFTAHRELVAQMTPEIMKTCEDSYKSCRALLYNKSVDEILIIDRLYDYEKHIRLLLKMRKMDMPRSKDPTKALLD